MPKSLLKTITHSIRTLCGLGPMATRRRKRRQTSVQTDALEPRLLMTVRVWDGGAAFNDKWSDPKNWAGDVSPVPFDDLVFPDGIGLLDRSSRNDFASNFVVRSIRLEGSDYKITGAKIQMEALGKIESVATTGTNTIEMGISLSSVEVQFKSTNRLVFSGTISSAVLSTSNSELRITTGTAGEVVFTGSTSNTFVSSVKVLKGLLTLNKTNGARAIVSNLQIGEPVNGLPAQVRKLSSSTAGQLNTTTPFSVTIFGGTLTSTLDIGSTNETINNLTMAGAVLRGTANLTVDGVVTTGNSPLTNLMDTRKLNMAGDGGFHVTGSPLTIRSQIDNARIEKDGSRLLLIAPAYAGNTFTNGLRILEGEVRLESPGGFAAVSAGLISVLAGPFSLLTVVHDASIADAVVLSVSGGTASLGGTSGERLKNMVISGGQVNLEVPLVIDNILQIIKSGVLNTTSSPLTVKGLTQFIVDSTPGTPTFFVRSNVRLEGGVEMRGGVIDAIPAAATDTFQLVIFGKLKSLPAPAPTFSPARITGRVAFSDTFSFGITLDVADGTAGHDLIIDADITGTPFQLNKVGLGTAVFNGNNNFLEAVNVKAGTLLVNGQHLNGRYVVSGGTLGGHGQVNTITANSGTVAPGASPGKLKVGGTQFFGPSKFLVELNGTTPVTQFDQLESAVILGIPPTGPFPTLDVRLGFTPGIGQEFAIIIGLLDNGVNGTRFQDTTGNVLDQGEVFLINGQAFEISYQANGGDAVSLKRVNNPPAFQNRQVTSAVEGGMATLSGLITETDPQDDFILEVKWNDGSPTETFVFPAGSPRDVSVTHRYVQDGSYDVHLLWKDNHGAFNTGNLPVVIRNARPEIQVLGFSSQVRAGQPFTLSGIIHDAGLKDAHRLTVHWGDSTPPQVLEIDPENRVFNLRHIFATRGLKRIRLTATDDVGRAVTILLNARILPPS